MTVRIFEKWGISALASSLLVTFHVVYGKRIWEDFMSEENSTGSNFIWAIAMIIIVGIIAATLYYSGFLSQKKKQDIDVEIKVPAASNTR